MGRLIVILAVVSMTILAVGAGDIKCRDKDYFEFCGQYSFCVCPWWNIATFLKKDTIFCKKSEMVCRDYPCWDWLESGIPTQPRKGPGGKLIKCNTDDDCSLQGGARCSPYGLCCTDTPLFP